MLGVRELIEAGNHDEAREEGRESEREDRRILASFGTAMDSSATFHPSDSHPLLLQVNRESLSTFLVTI